jgi:hypothetical protein
MKVKYFIFRFFNKKITCIVAGFQSQSRFKCSIKLVTEYTSNCQCLCSKVIKKNIIYVFFPNLTPNSRTSYTGIRKTTLENLLGRMVECIKNKQNHSGDKYLHRHIMLQYII